MKSALGEINENQSMNRLAADLAMATSLTDPFRQKLSSLMDEPSRLAGSFQSSMKNIQAITGASAGEIKTLGNELLKLGKNTVAGPLGVANAMNDIAGGVDNAASHLGILHGAVLLAEAGQADLGAAANGLVSVMNAYGLASGNATRAAENATLVSDVLTQTVGQGVGSMEQFIGAFSQVSGVSASVGVGFDEVGAALAFITTQGPSASEAATQLRAAETALLNPNETLIKALGSIGIESGSAMLKQYGLVESLNIVQKSVGGSQDAMAKALGSTMALQGATALLGDGYRDFSAKFGEALRSSVTAAAQAIQTEGYESKVARLNAATDSLQAQIGGNINAIKGFFVDMGTGFLTHVASPIMSSPVGGFFRGLTAVVGLSAKSILDMGSGALNTVTQLVMLTSTLQNAGGFAKLFGSTFGGLLSPLKKAGGAIAGMIGPLIAKTAATFTATAAEVGFAGAMWATAGAVWAATWPILAVVAGVALLAAGAYLLIKHWDAVSAFFVNLWNKITGAFSAAFDWIRNTLAGVSSWVLGAVAVFMPFVGIPLLIIKHWDTIKAFFAGLWVQVGETFSSAWSSITSVLASAANWFVGVWNGVSSFFVSLWNNITSLVANVANWFSGVWNSVTGAFASAWMWVKDLFFGVWENIKGVVLGFVEWLRPVIDIITAPFRAIGNVVGGIVGKVKGWFGDTVEMGQVELSKTVQIAPVTMSVPAVSGTVTSTAAKSPVVTPPVFSAPASVPAPVVTPLSIPMAASTETIRTVSSNNAGSAFLAGSLGQTPLTATSFSPDTDIPELRNLAMPEKVEVARVPREKIKSRERNQAVTIKIENLSVNAEEITSAFDFVRILMNAANIPLEAAV